jgi:hypothetical protein
MGSLTLSNERRARSISPYLISRLSLSDFLTQRLFAPCPRVSKSSRLGGFSLQMTNEKWKMIYGKS